MPKITAHSKIFRDWEGLLGACAQNASLLTNFESLKSQLEGFLVHAKEVKLQQETFKTQKGLMTQQLFEIEADGAEAARKLRALAFSQIGPHSEILKQFGLVPRARTVRRPTKRKTKAAKAQVASPPAEPPSSPPSQRGKEVIRPQGEEEKSSPGVPSVR